MEQTIKTRAKELFSEKNYSKAIDTLKEIGVDGFIGFALKVNKKEEKDNWFRNSDFCLALTNKGDFFSKVFNSKKNDELLFDYFNFAGYSPGFEKKLAEELPEQFVKAVQVSHSFLDSERIKLYSELQLPENLKIHLDIWKHLQKMDNEIWKNVEENLSQLGDTQGIELKDILIEALIWLEEKRFHSTSQKDLQHLSSVYNTFIPLIQYYFSQKVDFRISLVEDFKESFFERLKNKSIDRSINFLLENISEWIRFRDSILFPYCYDSTITPTRVNGITHFNRSPKSYYKWELDGCRYGLNRFFYFLKGAENVDCSIENNKITLPKGRQINDEGINYQLAIQNCQTGMFLSDLKITNFVFSGNKIPSQYLYIPLLAYTKNRNIRYEQGLEEQRKRSNNWKEAFLKLYLESEFKKIENYPFILLSEKDYIEMNNNAIKELPKNSSQDVVNLFSYSFKQRKMFDRFNKNYDVWIKPFLKIGKYLFCPTMFLANNDWFYAFAQAGLDNLAKSHARGERKTSATEMEKFIGQLFKSKNWDVKVFNDKEAGEVDGDVDIAINDGNTSLLIQLKRTKFRLDLKETYFEYINTDKKASKQLNDAEKWLSSKNELLKLKANTYKWILTTSFENVLSDVSGCLKVNYFDIIQALDNAQIKKLEDFIDYCEEDKGLQNWMSTLQNPKTPNELKYGIRESGLPLTLAEPKAYNQPLIADDNYCKEYYNKYKKALELAQKANKDKAIKVLETCASENPGDYEVWGTLANYYADVKKFSKSFECFEKAVEIIPDDPYILRNYALALAESVEVKESNKLFEKLHKEYWFLNLRYKCWE